MMNAKEHHRMIYAFCVLLAFLQNMQCYPLFMDVGRYMKEYQNWHIKKPLTFLAVIVRGPGKWS